MRDVLPDGGLFHLERSISEHVNFRAGFSSRLQLKRTLSGAIQTLTFRPAGQHIAEVKDFVFGIRCADRHAITIASQQLAEALCDAPDGF